MPKRKPTQRDVAKAANVSQGLVSLVLNNATAEVAEGTRIRIVEAAKRLGYTPKEKHEYEPRKKVPGKQGKLLAYISRTLKREAPLDHSIYDAYEEFYSRFKNRLVELAYQNGVSLLVRPCDNPVELTSWLIEWGVDGVIMHANNKALGEWISKRYPMVQINRRNVEDADAVMANQEAMIVIAMDYLRKHGHERIAFATESRDDDSLLRRKRAYLNYTREAGLRAYEEFLTCDNVGEMTSKLFRSQTDRPTAMITSDPNALMLQKEAIKRGLSLPSDLSIVGIDNISADVFATPALTSIDVRADEVTRVALSLILDRMKDPTLAFQKTEITPKLVIRESVTSPANKALTIHQ